MERTTSPHPRQVTAAEVARTLNGHAPALFRPGFLDAIAEQEDAPEDTWAGCPVRRLRRLAHEAEGGRQSPAYEKQLARVLELSDYGSGYSGITPEDATVIERVTARYGPPGLGNEDVIYVAARYRLPALLVHGEKLPEDRTQLLDRLPDCRPHWEYGGRDATVRERLEGRAERMLPGFDDPPGITHRQQLARWKAQLDYYLALPVPAPESQPQVAWLDRNIGEYETRLARGGPGHVYTPALVYRRIPAGTCTWSSNRKQRRHAEGAGRVMRRLYEAAKARNAPEWVCRDIITAESHLEIAIRDGRVPEGETELLVATVATRAQNELDALPRPVAAAPKPEPREQAPSGAVASVVVTDEQADADELDRARESVLGSLRRKMEAKPGVTDRELASTGQGKYRKLLRAAGTDMAKLIAEARAEG